MTKGRLEMFSDGVIAIIITIMVLELAQPEAPTWHALWKERHHFAIYALSFLGLGIYWNSHHQLFHIIDRINRRVVWINLIVLFWLSLIPYVTAWVGNGALTAPVAVYVAVHLMSGFSFLMLVETLIKENGADSRLAVLVGGDIKGKISMGLYLLAFGLAFLWPLVSLVLCGIVGLIWIVPDWRMAR